ncbi:hypothetical protein LguiB_019466 [Lonicera macranthoides]
MSNYTSSYHPIGNLRSTRGLLISMHHLFRSRELSGCFPSSIFDYPNYNKPGDVSVKFFKGASFVDVKSTKYMNSNLINKISSNEAVPSKDLEVISEKVSAKCGRRSKKKAERARDE